jgi:hypothetical protein
MTKKEMKQMDDIRAILKQVEDASTMDDAVGVRWKSNDGK